jgi:hypothetical protein
MRRGKQRQYGVIDQLIGRANPAERGAAGHQWSICAAQPAGNRAGLRSTQTHDTDAASSWRRRYGDDRVGCGKQPGLAAGSGLEPLFA